MGKLSHSLKGQSCDNCKKNWAKNICVGHDITRKVIGLVGVPTEQIISKLTVNTFYPLQSLIQSAKGRVDVPFVVYPHTGEEWREGG